MIFITSRYHFGPRIARARREAVSPVPIPPQPETPSSGSPHYNEPRVSRPLEPRVQANNRIHAAEVFSRSHDSAAGLTETAAHRAASFSLLGAADSEKSHAPGKACDQCLRDITLQYGGSLLQRQTNDELAAPALKVPHRYRAAVQFDRASGDRQPQSRPVCR